MEKELQAVIIEPSSPADAAVIWLHGLGADGHDFEPVIPALRLPHEHGIRFIFPHAPVRPITINGGMEMRGWYDIGGTTLERDVDEAGIEGSVIAVEAILDAQRDQGIDARRIVLAGFSQGGVIALHLGLRYSARLAGILALSTYLPLSDRLPAADAATQAETPIFVAHGSYDPLVPETLGRAAADHLRATGYTVDYFTYPMEHAVSAEEIDAIGAWLRQILIPR